MPELKKSREAGNWKQQNKTHNNHISIINAKLKALSLALSFSL